MRSFVLKDKADKDKDKDKADEVFCPQTPQRSSSHPIVSHPGANISCRMADPVLHRIGCSPGSKSFKTFPMEMNSSVLFGFPSPTLSLQLALSEGHNIVRVKTD